MRTDNLDVYTDFKDLHTKLYRAQFTMTKGDRIVIKVVEIRNLR